MAKSPDLFRFEEAGKLCKAVGWTDDELDLVIECMANSIGFLNHRGDCEIVVSKLRMELSSFAAMKVAREFDNRNKKVKE